MLGRLVESWALEARMGKADGHPVEPEELAAVLSEAASAASPSRERTKDGATRLVIENDRYGGTILLRERALLHMSLFPAG